MAITIWICFWAQNCCPGKRSSYTEINRLLWNAILRSVRLFRNLIVTLKTVEAIYQKKNVVIQLEPNFSFNDRALSLLAGIYSLLPPRLAVEVGYATYQRAADIPKIVERNSIRIFVLPAGESVGQLPDNFLLLDLATTPAPVKKTPLMETLFKWAQFPWERRQSAMQELFKDEREYQDETIFVQKSTACFDAIRSAERWSRNTSKNGTVSCLEELYAEYEAHQSQYVPWFDEMFRNRITALLKAPNTLDQLNAQAAEKLRTAIKEEQPQMRKVYLFGQKFGKVDINTLCNLVSEHQKSKDDIERALDRKKAEAALATERENTRKEVEAKNAAVAAEKEKLRQQLNLHRNENLIEPLLRQRKPIPSRQKRMVKPLLRLFSRKKTRCTLRHLRLTRSCRNMIRK